jgi:hypothetical protein
MADTDITEGIQIGQDAEKSKQPDFPPNHMPDCGNPANLDTTPKKVPPVVSDYGFPIVLTILADDRMPHSLLITVERVTLVNEPFERVLSLLADLGRDDPSLAFQGARLLGLYRSLWKSCVSKHLDGESLEKNNETSGEANMDLKNERDGLQLHFKEQQSRLLLLDRELELSRQRLISILNDWSQYSRGELTGLGGLG